MAFCDLHVHSTFSDGTDTPKQLIALAQTQKLQAIALTDHNTVAGLPEFLKAAAGSGVCAIAGTEFSTDYEGTELHILGLFLKPEDYAPITALLEDYKLRKEQSNLDLVDKLCRAGYQIDYQHIKDSTPEGQVNRALIGAELTRLSYTESIQDAFKQLLSPKCGYYVPPQRFSPFEIIRFIKSLGAVAVLAHPFLNLQEEPLCRFLKEAVACGLDGMEVLYSTYSQETTALAKQVADDFGLLHSGGSDYHGKNKPHIQMGVGQGDLAIPCRLMTALGERAKKYKKSWKVL
ncbi:MAG: PHP domain-containing protein [Ruminococcaceae bacterium]|nr:PHP domain-containing protein [Oscillospiraceae bacterium]